MPVWPSPSSPGRARQVSHSAATARHRGRDPAADGMNRTLPAMEEKLNQRSK